MESNLGPTENDFESAVSCPKKIKVLKRTAKKSDLSKNNTNVVNDRKRHKVVFSLQFNKSA